MNQFVKHCALGFAFLMCGTIASARVPQELTYPPIEFTPPTVEKRVLNQGTTAFLLEDRELPKIQLTIMVRTGSFLDPLDRVGLANMTAQLLRIGGTRSKTPDAINLFLESRGASIESGMSLESASLSLFCLKEDWPDVINLLGEILKSPRWDENKLKLLKAQSLEAIRRRNDDSFQIARRHLRQLVYGPHHPISRVEEVHTIKKIAPSDIRNFYEQYYTPQNMMVAVTGDFEMQAMLADLNRLFSDWPKTKSAQKEAVPLTISEEQIRSPSILNTVHKEGNQATVLFAQLGMKRHDPRQFTLEVLNEIVGGGGFTARLFAKVRTDLGLAYWAGSSFSAYWDYGTFAFGAQTKNATVGKAMQTILEIIRDVQANGVTQKEVDLAKEALINSYIFRFADAHSICEQEMNLDYFGFPADYLEKYPERVGAIQAQDVTQLARNFLTPENLKIVVVGNEQNYDVNLSTFAPVQKIELEPPQKK